MQQPLVLEFNWESGEEQRTLEIGETKELSISRAKLARVLRGISGRDTTWEDPLQMLVNLCFRIVRTEVRWILTIFRGVVVQRRCKIQDLIKIISIRRG